MSQSSEKRARRAWRNRMKATAGDDWEKYMKDNDLTMEGYEITFKRQRVIIIALSILAGVLAALCVWAWL